VECLNKQKTDKTDAAGVSIGKNSGLEAAPDTAAKLGKLRQNDFYCL
jgi:hypothetical protein